MSTQDDNTILQPTIFIYKLFELRKNWMCALLYLQCRPVENSRRSINIGLKLVDAEPTLIQHLFNVLRLQEFHECVISS